MIQEKSRLSLFLVAFSSVLLLGVIIGSVTFVYLYQRLVNERNAFAREAAHLSQELKRRSAVPAAKETVIREDKSDARAQKMFLNEGALGFSFLYPSELYFDLSFVVRPWVTSQVDTDDTMLYGCFSKILPPGPNGRETEPYWCSGSVSVRKLALQPLLNEYQKYLTDQIGEETMDGGKITDAKMSVSDVAITPARLFAKKVEMTVEKKRVTPDALYPEWTEISVDYLIPREEFIYIFSNEGFSDIIDESTLQAIVESIVFLR